MQFKWIQRRRFDFIVSGGEQLETLEELDEHEEFGASLFWRQRGFTFGREVAGLNALPIRFVTSRRQACWGSRDVEFAP